MAINRKLYNEFLDLIDKRPKAKGQPNPELMMAAYNVLQDAANSKSDVPLELRKVLRIVNNVVADHITGTPNELLLPVKCSKGKSGRTGIEDFCIEAPVRYHRAATQGVIEDKHYVRTILDAFGGDDPSSGGIGRTTVKDWVKDPRFKSIKPSDEKKEMLLPTLRFAGALYQRKFTRSARAKKNKKR